MRIERKIIKAARILAGKLFRAKAKPGSHVSPDRIAPTTELHPCSAGTLLLVRRGYRGLSRIVSSERVSHPVSLSQQWLQACQGGCGEVEITLSDDSAEFRWEDKAFPAALRLGLEPATELATLPELSAIDARLLTALAATSGTVDHDSSRYALHCVQLDGQRGTVTGTDGRQLLRFDGFKFPWNDQAILIPASSVFACPELRGTSPLACGITDKQLLIEAAPWTLRLPLEVDARYPNVDAVIQRYSKAVNRVYFDPRDLEFFAENIRHIPGADQPHSPVTLDLNGHVELAAGGDAQTCPMRIRLGRSLHVGPAARCSGNRDFLHLAAKLRLSELLRFGDADPVVCRGEHVILIWQPLSGVTVPEDGPGTIKIDSAAGTFAAV
jgi:hypothetical protein